MDNDNEIKEGISNDNESKHKPDIKCLVAFEYINQIPGKDIRGLLIDCFQLLLNIPEDKIVIVKEIIKSLHNASLLVDDIEDNSKLRRGLPVAHSIYGIANTINCANYVYFLALEKCHQLKSSTALDIFVKEILNLHRGQGQDIYWREQCTCPSEEEYKQMVIDKTGGLFRLAVGLMQAFSTNQKDFTKLLNVLSLYFQIRDDYLNISSVEYMQTKSFCEDLTEGKFSYPIIHAIHSRSDDSRLLNILRQRTEDIEVKKYAVLWMQQMGSMQYTKETLCSLHDEVKNEIENLGLEHSNQLILLLNKLHVELYFNDDENIDESTSMSDNKAYEITLKKDKISTL